MRRSIHRVVCSGHTYRGVRMCRGAWSTHRAAPLLDHLVGLEEERRGDRQAQGLGGLEVDD